MLIDWLIEALLKVLQFARSFRKNCEYDSINNSTNQPSTNEKASAKEALQLLIINYQFLEHYHLPRSHRLITGKRYPQTVHPILHVIGKIRIVCDRVEEESLFAITQLLVIRLVAQVDPLIFL